MEQSIVVTIILSVIVVISLYQGLTTRHYLVNSKMSTQGKSIRLALISDVHCQVFGRREKHLLEVLSEKKPDMVILSGDIIDSGASLSGLALLLKNISKTAPVFYVFGNHEYRSGISAAIAEIASSYGIRVLSDEYQVITIKDTAIIVAGVNDPSKALYSTPTYNMTEAMEKTFANADKVIAYKILIGHRPEPITIYNKYSFDLILSGHTHGGQVRLPFILNGLWAPDQGLFPKLGGGLYKHGNTTQIVSRGLCFRWHLPRIFNPPELVIVDIV